MIHEIVAALIVRSQEILLGKRSAARAFYPDVWDVFGGHMEPGEQTHETLIRELQEELGITPAQWEYVEMIRLPSQPDASDSVIVHLYRVTEWAGTPTNLQLDEHSTIGWFTLEEAIQLPLADPSYPMLFARQIGEAS